MARLHVEREFDRRSAERLRRVPITVRTRNLKQCIIRERLQKIEQISLFFAGKRHRLELRIGRRIASAASVVLLDHGFQRRSEPSCM